ncbi:hypothetical protein EON83_04770 [bacterium]|nr:MAG: hypothetical protein EON83_04770 [bacterium]
MSDTWARDIDWQDIEARFSPPPELQAPTPRRVIPRNNEEVGLRARTERGCLAGCLLPMLLLGLMCMFWGGLAALILPLGTTTTGIVTGRERGNGREKTYFLDFRFQANTHTYQAQGQVPTEKWKHTNIGDTVRVRYFPFAPALRPLLADDFSPWASILGMGIMGFLLVGVSALPLLALATERRDKRLVSIGLTTPAFIIAHDTTKNQLTLLFRDQEGRTREIKARPKSTTFYQIGQIQTALYLPNRPQNAYLYNELDWKAQLI